MKSDLMATIREQVLGVVAHLQAHPAAAARPAAAIHLPLLRRFAAGDGMSTDDLHRALFNVTDEALKAYDHALCEKATWATNYALLGRSAGSGWWPRRLGAACGLSGASAGHVGRLQPSAVGTPAQNYPVVSVPERQASRSDSLVREPWRQNVAGTMKRSTSACRDAERTHTDARAIRARAVETRLTSQHERARSKARKAALAGKQPTE